MRATYALERLDALISVDLSPDKGALRTLLPEEISKLNSYIINEKNKVLSAVKFAVFNLNNETSIRCAIRNYHTSLVSMLDEAIENKGLYPGNSTSKNIFDTIIASIEEVLLVIENRFSRYLGIEERIPSTHFNAIKKKLLKRVSQTVKRLRQCQHLFPALDIIVNELQQLLNKTDNKNAHTFREMYYAKELCEEMESLQLEKETALYTCLDKVLVRLNFNSQSYIDDLKNRITEHFNTVRLYPEQMELLLLDFKLFNQIHLKPERAFLPQEASLSKQIGNWFSQEIFYLEKRLYFPTIPPKEKGKKTTPNSKDADKLLSTLSVDQMALVLRAADDLRIVAARSLNSVFKNIVPYLSTPYQENISYDSMRSKSYVAETRDKKIVVDTLRQIIQKVNEY